MPVAARAALAADPPIHRVYRFKGLKGHPVFKTVAPHHRHALEPSVRELHTVGMRQARSLTR